jgi:hypothetical protein
MIVARTSGGHYREDIRVARKTYRCESFGCAIKPGDRYLIATDYPGSGIGYATQAGHPVRMRFCRDCAATSFEETTT